MRRQQNPHSDSTPTRTQLKKSTKDITVFWINNLKYYTDNLKKILTNLAIFIAGLTALLLQKNSIIKTYQQK